MRGSVRSVIGGAFGALTAATIAASAAYACTPSQEVLLSSSYGLPDTVVRVEANGFDAGKTVEFRWGTTREATQVLATDVAERIGFTSRASAVVTVPSDATVGNVYLIVAFQQLDDDDFRRRATPITVDSPPAPARTTQNQQQNQNQQNQGQQNQQNQGQPSQDQPSQDQQQNLAQQQEQLEPALPGADPAPTRPQAPADRTGSISLPGTGAGSTAVQGAPGPAAAPATDRTVAAPAAPAAAPLEEAPLRSSSPQPAANDLWSGLPADGTPSLLEAPAPAGRDSSAPFGAVLLGVGVVALAAVALATGRRRLALAVRR